MPGDNPDSWRFCCDGNRSAGAVDIRVKDKRSVSGGMGKDRTDHFHTPQSCSLIALHFAIGYAVTENLSYAKRANVPNCLGVRESWCGNRLDRTAGYCRSVRRRCRKELQIALILLNLQLIMSVSGIIPAFQLASPNRKAYKTSDIGVAYPN